MMQPEAMPVSFDVRALRVGDRSAAIDLMRLTLGDRAISRKTEDYWVWKHERNPFGPSYGVCAVDPTGEGLAGLRMLMRWRFARPADESVRAVRAVDTATHPDYQRRGIFSSLTTFAIDELRGEGTSFVFNTPNQNSLPGYLKMGWRVVERWPVYVRPLRPVRTSLAAVRARLRRSLVEPLSLKDAGLQPWDEFTNGAGEEAAEVVAAHEAGRAMAGFRTPRDMPYLNWRYGGHPDVRYGVHELRHGRRLDGFAIARPAPGLLGLNALVITELFVRAPQVAAIGSLLRSLRGRGRAHYLMAHFAAGTVELAALRRAGFFAAPGRGYTWTARELNPVQPDPAAASSWDLTIGELEIF